MKLNQTNLLLIALCALAPLTQAMSRQPIELKQNEMQHGEMDVRDFGSIKMHVYNTKDSMDDFVLILEKKGKAVLIESPAFYANFDELAAYLAKRDITAEGILTPYHPLGGSFINHEHMTGMKAYLSEHVLEYWKTGFGAVMKAGIPKRFGDQVDGTMYDPSVLLKTGPIKMAGI